MAEFGEPEQNGASEPEIEIGEDGQAYRLETIAPGTSGELTFRMPVDEELAAEEEPEPIPGAHLWPCLDPIDVEKFVVANTARQRVADRRRSKVNGESQPPKHERTPKPKEPGVTPKLELREYEDESELDDEERERRLRQSAVQQLRELPYARLIATKPTSDELEQAERDLREHSRTH